MDTRNLSRSAAGQPGTLTCATTDRAAANESIAFLGPLRHVTAAGVDFAYHRFHIGEVKEKTPLVSGLWLFGAVSVLARTALLGGSTSMYQCGLCDPGHARSTPHDVRSYLLTG